MEYKARNKEMTTHSREVIKPANKPSPTSR